MSQLFTTTLLCDFSKLKTICFFLSATFPICKIGMVESILQIASWIDSNIPDKAKPELLKLII